MEKLISGEKGIDPVDQRNVDLKLNSDGLESKNRRAGSLARLGHLLDVQKVAGSSPVRPTKNLLCLKKLARGPTKASHVKMKTLLRQ